MVQASPSIGGYAIMLWPESGPRNNEGLPMANSVDPAYSRVLMPRLVEGRFFTDADNQLTAAPVAVVNERLARRWWPNESAIGHCIHVYKEGQTPPCATVVGVMAKSPWFSDIRAKPDEFEPVVLLPIERFPDAQPHRALIVRTTVPARTALSRLRQEAQSAVPLLPYVDAVTFDESMDFQYRPLRLGMALSLGLSALALVIAIAGLAVVTAHGVTRRTREMGIRLVLGAEPGDLVRLMARRTIVAMSIGLAVGAGLAYAGVGALQAVLFGVEPADPRVFTVAIAALFLVGGVAAWIPARRTTRIEPSAALRVE